jgi:thiamine biosynthesis lipoprotein
MDGGWGHILDPRTGWPVEGAPRSVTVMAGSCIEAGTLATLAILRGPHARASSRSRASNTG